MKKKIKIKIHVNDRDILSQILDIVVCIVLVRNLQLSQSNTSNLSYSLPEIAASMTSWGLMAPSLSKNN